MGLVMKTGKIAGQVFKALISGWADFFWIVVGSFLFSVIILSGVLLHVLPESGAVNGEYEGLIFATSVGSSALFLSFFVFLWPKAAFLSGSSSRSLTIAVALLALSVTAKWVLNRVFDENENLELYRSSVIVVVLICLIVPVIEEAFFRGLAWTTFLSRSVSELGALYATSILFVIAHVPLDLNSFIQLAGMALALGFMRYFSGSIWIGVVAHSATNLVVFFNL